MEKTKDLEIDFSRGKTSDKELIDLYIGLKFSRQIEEKMLNLLRQGRISKWFSGIGQEAISVGVTKALKKNEFIFPLHRNLGIFTSREVPLHRLISQWQGKADGFTKGRDRSFHFGSMEHHIVGMISHLGPQLSLAAGAALGGRLEGSGKVALAITGEGGTSEGEFHEALNVAAVWQLPVIFVVENNGYGLSTPVNEQYRCERLADRGIGYGMKSFILDGNNVLEIYQFVSKWAKQLRKKPEPILLECLTFRMRGHEEASGTKYVPKTLMETWAQRDPVSSFESFLLREKVLNDSQVHDIAETLQVQIDRAVQESFVAEDPVADLEKELKDVYRDDREIVEKYLPSQVPPGDRSLRFIDAITEALDQAMEQNERLVLMGQDIGAYGGVFKVTEGLIAKYGPERVRNTPLCESAIIGVALGLTFEGYHAMVEMQFSDFVSCGFNQLVNNLAKIHYRWGHAANVVIRMPTGGDVGAGPFHSQSIEGWFLQTPGLKIVYPSNPYDAKGLLMAAFADPNPVLYFEHKKLYRTLTDAVPIESYQVPIGKAALVTEGNAMSVITYGLGVHWAVEAASSMNIEADILDLRSLAPLDYKAIEQTVAKTGRVIILHEATLTGGPGAEIAAYISEYLFEALDAPVMRCASLDTPVPFAAGLEEQFLPKIRLKETFRRLLDY